MLMPIHLIQASSNKIKIKTQINMQTFMSLDQAIKTLRSIRKFHPAKVSRKLVIEALAAAGWAPSAEVTCQF